MAQKLDPVVDRCERAPQLMAEHRQKLVLAAVGAGQILHLQSRPEKNLPFARQPD